jgi:hypothetical protein
LESAGPFTLFVWGLKSLVLWVAIAFAWLALMRRKHGGYDLKDWVVAIGAGGATVIAFIVSTHLQARWLEHQGSEAQGTLVRKWMVEGDDSTTFKIAVVYSGVQDEFEVGEAFYDTAQPNTPIPVYYDTSYPADFVPKQCAIEAPEAEIVIGLLASGGLVILLSMGWVLIRTVERFRSG